MHSVKKFKERMGYDCIQSSRKYIDRELNCVHALAMYHNHWFLRDVPGLPNPRSQPYGGLGPALALHPLVEVVSEVLTHMNTEL